MTDSAANPAAAPFPPDTLEAFLRLCAGEWMNLRSQFDLGDDADGDNGDEWHTSERGDLVVTYLAAEGSHGAGGLSVGPKGSAARQLLFAGNGSFQSLGSGGSAEGNWQLWPDGSLELVLSAGEAEVHERIWFTKPNLRLRSTVEHRADGTPGRASFSSEIRRVSRPAA
jgi:hypothetical protein